MKLTYLLSLSLAVFGMAGCKKLMNRDTDLRQSSESKDAINTGNSKSIEKKPGCGLGIINGVRTNKFRATYLIRNTADGGCTGTFVGLNTLVTAAHCIVASDVTGGVSLVSNEVTPPSLMPGQASSIVIKSPNFDASLSKAIVDSNIDFAILIFAADVASEVQPISNRRGTVEEAVTMVGYGDTEFDFPTGFGVKRYGKNELYQLSSEAAAKIDPSLPGKLNETYSIVGNKYSSIQDTSEIVPFNSGVAHGDSGGPLILGGAIIGIASAAATSGFYSFGMYFDLTSPLAKSMIEEAKLKGGKFTFADPIPEPTPVPTATTKPEPSIIDSSTSHSAPAPVSTPNPKADDDCT